MVFIGNNPITALNIIWKFIEFAFGECLDFTSQIILAKCSNKVNVTAILESVCLP